MHNLVWLLVAVACVFLLTYDPRSRKLEKYIQPESQCDTKKFQELQFNVKAPAGVCKGEPKTCKGAII